MTSIGSNIASSSGVGSSEGPLVPSWVSLTLEEHFQNFKRMFHMYGLSTRILNPPNFKSVAKVVEALRMDPCGDIPSQDSFFGLQGSTPLYWAVLMDDRVMVRYILSSGKVNINTSTKCHESALTYAIICGNDEIVEDFLEYKADVFMYGAFCKMVYEKDSMFDILKRILANNVNECDEKKKTALHYVAREGYIDDVEYLLNEKADVNLKDEVGYTPLHYAAEQGATNIVSLLVDHNADVDSLDNSGRSLLLRSLAYRRVDTSNALITHDADVNGKDDGNNNALHLAIQAYGVENNMMSIVKFLRERDVDANAKNSKGWSPFFTIVVKGHTEVVKELLKNKEQMQLMDECNGQTTIQIACDYDYENIKRMLLQCDDVSRYVETLYRDRQVYVDAANAILVGAALIASVTFASWLQPPLGYTTSYLDLAPSSSDINYVDVQHNASLRAFWVFNTLSFYFAIGTVVFGARSVLPRRKIFIKDIVEKLHQNLLVTSILLACSVFCVIAAFGIVGCIVLTPTLKFQ